MSLITEVLPPSVQNLKHEKARKMNMTPFQEQYANLQGIFL